MQDKNYYDCMQIKQLVTGEFIQNIAVEMKALEEGDQAKSQQYALLAWMKKSIEDYSSSLKETMRKENISLLDDFPKNIPIDTQVHILNDLKVEVPPFMNQNLPMLDKAFTVEEKATIANQAMMIFDMVLGTENRMQNGEVPATPINKDDVPSLVLNQEREMINLYQKIGEDVSRAGKVGALIGLIAGSGSVIANEIMRDKQATRNFLEKGPARIGVIVASTLAGLGIGMALKMRSNLNTHAETIDRHQLELDALQSSLTTPQTEEVSTVDKLASELTQPASQEAMVPNDQIIHSMAIPRPSEETVNKETEKNEPEAEIIHSKHSNPHHKHHHQHVASNHQLAHNKNEERITSNIAQPSIHTTMASFDAQTKDATQEKPDHIISDASNIGTKIAQDTQDQQRG